MLPCGTHARLAYAEYPAKLARTMTRRSASSVFCGSVDRPEMAMTMRNTDAQVAKVGAAVGGGRFRFRLNDSLEPRETHNAGRLCVRVMIIRELREFRVA